MSSQRVEAFRRTTSLLLAQQRAIDDAKKYFANLSDVQRAEFAGFLLLATSLKLGDGSECAVTASDLALRVEVLKEKLLRRAMADSPVSTYPSCVRDSSTDGLAPSASPSAASKFESMRQGQLEPRALGTPPTPALVEDASSITI